jgi:hypothetical protein
VATGTATLASTAREWSSMKLMISTGCPSSRPGVEAIVDQPLAPGHDLVLECRRGEVGRHLGPAFARCQCLVATRLVQGDVAVHPGLRAPCRRGDGPHRASFDEHGVDAVLGQINGTTSERVSQNC